LYEAKGELISRDAEKEKTETMFGMAQGQLTEKKAAFDAGEAKLMGGIGGLAGGVLGGLGSGAIGKGSKLGDLMSGESSGGAFSIFS
jgi:outer membrane lipoprotein SlyB